MNILRHAIRWFVQFRDVQQQRLVTGQEQDISMVPTGHLGEDIHSGMVIAFMQTVLLMVTAVMSPHLTMLIMVSDMNTIMMVQSRMQ